jgi:hypothetical protein
MDAERLQVAERIGWGDFPQAVKRGQSPHLEVYSDPALGPDGIAVAAGVVANCERYYNRIKTWFGEIELPSLPLRVIIVDLGGESAYRYGPDGIDIYCNARISPTVQPAFTSFLTAAQVVEIFEAAQGGKWNCGYANGEALSRVLAAVICPYQLGGLTTASAWLDGDRADFVNYNAPTDDNPVANGCALLFLNYLRYQLGWSWRSIVENGRTYAGVDLCNSDRRKE